MNFYTPDELLIRAQCDLWEHVLECFSCRELGRIWGCSKDWANEIRREPWALRGHYGDPDLQNTPRFTYEMKRQLIAYLETAA